MISLVEIGTEYLGADSKVRNSLMSYYNEHCYPLVDKTRRYRIQPNDQWCAMFTSVLAHKAGRPPDAFPYEVSVYYQCQKAREWGAYTEASDYVKQGDLLVYDWNGNKAYDHVGIVADSDADGFIVLEGNYKNTVGLRRVSRSSKAIRGFILLDATKPIITDERVTYLALRALRGEFGNGKDRAVRLGVDYAAVQAKINQLMQ